MILNFTIKLARELNVTTYVIQINKLFAFYFSGIFFILPCIDAYARVDLRTRTYDIPPQEVSNFNLNF